MKNIKKYLSNQSGQMVILVMLVLVIALTIGLSLITRTISNTRLSTNTELSNRAYSAAEAGIEEALRSNRATGPAPSGNIGTGNTQTNFNTTVSTQGNDKNPFIFPNPVSQDETNQIWLFNYQGFQSTQTFPAASCATNPPNYYSECANNTLTLYWGTSQDTSGSSPVVGENIPAIEVTFVYLDQSNAFGIEKCAYDPNSTRANNENSFLYPGKTEAGTFCGNTIMSTTIKSIDSTTQGTKYFAYNKEFVLTNSTVSPFKRYLLMRMKLLYNDNQKHEIAVKPGAVDANPASSNILPAQGQIIESTGNAGDVVRKIRVYQSFPTLPGLFDFVLFNGSASNPLSKN